MRRNSVVCAVEELTLNKTRFTLHILDEVIYMSHTCFCLVLKATIISVCSVRIIIMSGQVMGKHLRPHTGARQSCQIVSRSQW